MAESQEDRAVRYDPGPSGTAVAGLIIALIALAVALYAAFAPFSVRPPDQATQLMIERAVQAELDARTPKMAKDAQTAATWAARNELSRAYIVPSPGPDPGMEAASNIITLQDRKRWSYKRIE